jgi:predicted metal-dependent enzyme (double-stranded beta helix superfamily)
MRAARTSAFPYVRRPYGRDLNGEELERFVGDLAGCPELWIDLVKHDPNQRVYEELIGDEHVTAWLICWMEEQDTGFHDHDISSGAVAVVSGRVREQRLTLNGEPTDAVYEAGESFRFAPTDIHRVRHAGDTPTVTLHAYSPPLLSMGAYVVEENGRLNRREVPSSEELHPLRVASTAPAASLDTRAA